MANCGCKDSCSCIIRAGSDNVTIVGAGTNGSPMYISVDEGFVAEHTHPVGDVEAVGTPSGTTFLRGDGTWAVPSGSAVSDGTVAGFIDDPGSATRDSLDALYDPIGGGGGGALPEGIGNQDDYTAIDGAVINAGTATTGFFGGTPALVLTDGLTRVQTQIASMASQKAGYNLSPAQTPGTRAFVVLEMAWGQADGFTGTAEMQHLMLASGATLTGSISQIEVPYFPPNKWITLVIPVGALTSVASVGVINDRGGYQTGGQKITNWWSGIRWANQTEVDQALAEGAVLIPPDYVPGITAEVNEPVVGKTRVNLDPDVAWIDRLGGVRNIREWGVPEDGLTECSAIMSKALSSLDYGDKMVFPPDGKYWVDYPVGVPSGVTVDFNGSVLFSRIMRGGNNNVQDPTIRVTGQDIRLIRPTIFGYRELTTTGANLTTVAGTPTNSGNNKLLDAQNESVQVLTVNAKVPWFARHPLVMFPTADRALILATYPTFELGNAWVFTLSSTSAVAGDCVIEAVNTMTGVVEASRALTLTTTPTEYVLAWEPTNLEAQVSVRVRKATATANTITVASLRSFGFTQYSSANDSANAIQITNGSNIIIEDFHIEGATTDAVDWTSASNNGVIVRRGVSRACLRQGLSFNRGYNATVSDVLIIGPHRSGVDIEPYDQQWVAGNITLRNIRVVGAENYGLALNNWAGIVNLNLDTITTERCLAGGVLGGSRGGVWNNIHSDSDIYIKGQGVRASNLTCTTLIIGEEEKLFDDGTSYLATVAGAGGPANSFTVDSTSLLVVGQRINLSAGGAVTATDRRITAIAGLVVTFDGDPVTWSGTMEVYDGKALVESSDNVVDGVTVTGVLATQVRGKNWVRGVRGTAQSPHSSTLANVQQGSSGGVYSDNDDALTDQFGFSFRAPRSTHPPFVHGGLNLRGQSLLGVRGLTGDPTIGTIQSVSGQGVGRATSTSLDLGVRGLSVAVVLDASNVVGTNARLTVAVETSQDNANWYPVDTFRDALANATVEVMHVRFAERYLRTSYVFTADGGSPSVTFGTSVMYGVPMRNLSGTWTGASSSSPVLAFPSRTGPNFSQFDIVANATTSTLGAGTYYYRVGARTRLSGPTTWLAEKSVTITANQSINITLTKWHGRHGYWTDGLSVLRGTVAGTYTQRFDIMPKAGVETFSYRHDIQTFTDTGASVLPGGIAVEFPTTYPTPSPKLTATDESGYELDTNYRVFTMPAYTSIVKRTDGFTPTFGAALTSFEWFIVR